MLSMAELIMDDPKVSQENKERLDIIYCSCSYLLCLINDLLDYSQIVAGCLKVSSIQFDLNSMVEECFKTIQIQLRNKSIDLKLIKTQVPDFIISDPNRLKQIILNLLGNSVKFTLEGSITLEIQGSGNKLLFAVKDTGVGIPSEKIPSLFRQFGKLEQTLALNPQGAGLGLFISNMLTFKLGGSGISVVSEQGSGSCFSFEITLEENHCEKDAELKKSKKNNQVCGDLAGSTILIIDDTPFNVMVMQQILEKEGFVIENSNNGQDGIEKVMAKAYDLIFMDCEMPIMDGWETTKQLKILKDSSKVEKLPIIIGYTSHNYSNIIEKCKEVGMDDVIIKPYPREKLIKRVKKWIKSRKV